MLCGITIRFQKLSHSQRQVTHVLLTRPPLRISKQASIFSVRLACVKRAASVRPEPGSNSLFKLYIQTLRVFISILAITIRSQLPLWFFRLFWLLKIPNLFGISRAFSLVVHCSIFKILVSGFRAATFTLYHIQKFLSSKQFVNCCSFLLFSSFPSRCDQLFYFITSCSVCQVNILWTEVQIAHFSSPRTSCPKQSASLFYHTFAFLSSELFLNNLHQPLSISRFVLWLPLLFRYLNFRSRATALLLYHISPPLSRK